ncbi:MAG: glycosyltransferase [Cyanobacteria bacterium J06560_6]
MKILISAYSCEPNRGSESGVGWNFAKAVAKHHQVWVMTRPDESKEAIEVELKENPDPNLNFVYFTLPFWQDSMRLGQSGAMQIHYYLWQVQAYFVARRLHQEIGFDAAHHATFVRYSTPSFLSLLPIPFVWGPVGGAEQAPKPFFKDFSAKAKLYETARWLVHKVGEYDPFTRLTAQRSTLVRATTNDTAKQLQKMGATDVQIASESGLAAEEITRLNNCPLPETAPIRFISMGRLLHWKGFYLGIKAFAAANLPEAEYWIVGDGPEMENFQALAKELGVADRVKFLGRLPRDRTLEKLTQSHVLVHPSLHDSGGWVCLEGMAAGRPILCLDLGGPAVQVTNETGFRIAAHTPEQVVQDMSAAMTRLAHEPELLTQMSQAGKRLVREHYSWQRKGENLSQLYQVLCEA